ncbi:MAG TPA: phospholipase D-like domain-containing protein [Steroidobacter sp.]|nr:phospholipase D-like domain-containing protein [Steroidobacter sp.]
MTFDKSASGRRRFRKRWVAGGLFLWWAGVGVWQSSKPMPAGTDLAVAAPAREVAFFYDLTYRSPQGGVQHEQRIFDEAFRIIDEADSFVVADFFLINDMMGQSDVHRRLSRELADHLLARKKAAPSFSALLITDPINTVYGGARSPLLEELRSAGVDVVFTDLERLRDSNPLYSSFWRMFLQWWDNSAEGGAALNPFASGGSRITLRSWLALLNFKANHRKLIVADRSDGSLVALVTSANPHDASSAHSNVALRFSGRLAQEILESETALARFSGWRGRIYAPAQADLERDQDAPELALLSEHGVARHLLDAIAGANKGDAIRIAAFYLSDRDVIEALLAAAARGVRVNIILDPNRDAFGRRKDGVPNRPAANELVARSNGRIAVRWYRTHGEQFHAKLALITQGDRLLASLGSANFTRRNIDNYNLEANVAVRVAAKSPLALEMTTYFERLWNNEGEPGAEYTAPFALYRDEDRGRYWRYRLMEATGLSTF